MTRHAVYLHLDLLEALPKRGSQQQKIVRFVHSLAENPFTEGDFTDKDETLRPRQIKIIGGLRGDLLGRPCSENGDGRGHLSCRPLIRF
jgi:hypothetical protein